VAGQGSDGNQASRKAACGVSFYFHLIIFP
jgi:hypothetical protein